MKYQAKLAIFLIGMIVFLLGPAPVRAQGDSANISLAADAAFDSFYKDAHWVPVRVTVANSGSAIDGQLRLVTGSSAANTRVTYLAPIALPTQSSKQVTLFVHLSSFANRLKVDLLNERGDVIRTVDTDPLERLDTDDLLYVVVSNDPGELTYLENVTGSRSQAAVAFTTLDGLPAIAAAWNAIDVLVFNDIDTGRLSPAQNEALKSWIGTGGQLVVTGGAGWQQTVNGVSDLLPVTVNGNESVTALPLLEGLADEPFREAGPYLLTVSQLTEGDVVLEQDGVPILARRAIGRGSVYFLALDPNAPPLLNWDGAELLWGRIAEQSQPLPFYAAGIKDSYAAQEAISTLPSLSLPSVWGVLCFLSFYIFAIGPVNYLILKRRGRRELAWLTIPSLILFFSAATYVVGFRVRGNDAIVNQMSIAYGQIGGEQMRVQGVVGLYSPKRTTYDMTVPENNLLRPFQAEFGGIGAGGAVAGIEQNGTVTALDVRVDISGIETFLVDSYTPTPDISGQAILRLEGSRFLLDVDVQNNSDLDVAHAALLFGNRVESVGALAPGARFQDSFSLASRSLSPSGGPATFGPTGPGSSVLSYQTGLLVGSSTPYDDPVTLSRSNLLRSLEYGYGSTTPMNIPAGVATLILWTNAPQFDIEVSGLQQSNEATTLYFLELPFSEITENGTEITLDDTLQTWRLLDSSGIYNPTPSGIELTNGWAEFEFIPWPTFQSMQVDKLSLNMEQGSYGSSTAPPQVSIWEWDAGSWASLTGVGWGVNNIPLERSFVGPQNAVRLRVSNSGFQMISVETFYPILTGTLGE